MMNYIFFRNLCVYIIFRFFFYFHLDYLIYNSLKSKKIPLITYQRNFK